MCAVICSSGGLIEYIVHVTYSYGENAFLFGVVVLCMLILRMLLRLSDQGFGSARVIPGLTMTEPSNVCSVGPKKVCCLDQAWPLVVSKRLL